MTTFFKGPMLVIRRRSSVSRHTTVSEWEILDRIDFDSSDDNNMNLLTKFVKPVLVPVDSVSGYTPSTAKIFCKFDPELGTVSWASKF